MDNGAQSSASLSASRYTVWLLRLIGVSTCLAFFPMFFRWQWMAGIHGWLGLGELPHVPVVEYLARSLSALYFAHGCLVLVVSTDVVRYRPIALVVAGLNVFLGGMFVVIDSWSGLPWWWIAGEGPPILAIGCALLWCLRAAAPASDEN